MFKFDFVFTFGNQLDFILRVVLGNFVNFGLQAFISFDVDVGASILKTKEGHQNYINKNTSNGNTHDLGILVLSLSIWCRDRESLSDGTFNGRGGRGSQVTQLARHTNDRQSVLWRKKLEQASSIHAPSTLDTQLHEKYADVYRTGSNKGTWVDHGTNQQGGSYNGKFSTKEGRKASEKYLRQ